MSSFSTSVGDVDIIDCKTGGGQLQDILYVRISTCQFLHKMNTPFGYVVAISAAKPLLAAIAYST